MVAAVWFVTLRPSALGGQVTYVVVRGTSMEGVLAPGDLAVVAAADQYSIGDVVAYHIPDGPGKGELIIHRITGGDASGYVTKGDHNNHPDPWHPAQPDIVGKLTTTVPGLGSLLALGRNPPVFGAVWAIVAFVLMLALTAHGKIKWKYEKVMGLTHWPLAPAESPRWVTQAVYRNEEGGSRAKGLQVWSQRQRAWVDVLAPTDGVGKAIWSGGPAIEFGDPMVVEATPAEVDSYIARSTAGVR